jgi:hypothetical protein
MSYGNWFARTYDEQAHRRARDARDERLNGEGPTDWHRQGPKNQNHQRQLDSNRDSLSQQLSDRDFFSRHTKARFRLREIRPSDRLDLDDELANLLQILVSRRGGRTVWWRASR